MTKDAESTTLLPSGQAFEEAATTLKGTLLEMWTSFIEHLPLIVISLIIIGATWGVARLFDKTASRLHDRFDTRRGLRDVVERLARLGIWIVGLTIAAMVLFPGLTPSSALAGLGVGSVAVGFAFKDVFENFFAGMLILAREPFRVGDFVECEDVEGRVCEITVRNTFIDQVDGQKVVIPNAMMFKNPVFVVTERDTRRIDLVVGVGYGEDVQHAKEVVAGALDGLETIDRGHEPVVEAAGFGASSVDLRILWWTRSDPASVRASRDEVITAVKRALDEAGVEIPFPYRTLTFGEPLRLKKGRDAANAQAEDDASDALSDAA